MGGYKNSLIHFVGNYITHVSHVLAPTNVCVVTIHEYIGGVVVVKVRVECELIFVGSRFQQHVRLLLWSISL